MKYTYKIFLMLIAIFTGVDFVQAKVACVKGYEWRNGRCRKKVKAKPHHQDPVVQDDSLDATPNNPVVISEKKSDLTFTPAQAFNDGELVAHYFDDDKTVTIVDAAGNIRYKFENVQYKKTSFFMNFLSTFSIQPTQDSSTGLTFIGKYTSSSGCLLPRPSQMCTMAITDFDFYGNLVPKN